MIYNRIARNLLNSKKLYIAYIVTFQKNIEVDLESILDSYNFRNGKSDTKCKKNENYDVK